MKTSNQRGETMEYAGPVIPDSLTNTMRSVILLSKDTGLEWGFVFRRPGDRFEITSGTDSSINLPGTTSTYLFHTHPLYTWMLNCYFSPTDIREAAAHQGSFLGIPDEKGFTIKYLSNRAFRPEDARKIELKDRRFLEAIGESPDGDIYRQQRLEFFRRLDNKAVVVATGRWGDDGL
ncbi:MAG: hypothetical protein JRM72_01655 [Nitrososphaerota archaeon]|nr:hypothetical protein [Nitrososphaerota archaeon]